MVPAERDRSAWGRVIVTASGPSFDEAQAHEVALARAEDRCRVIAVNDTYRRVPSADVLYACDGKWWGVHAEAVRASGFRGELWTQDERAAAKYQLNRVRVKHRDGLSREPGVVHGGGNGGYQAIGLAFNRGARLIVLVGFDMQRTGGQSHFFGDHPKALDHAAPFDKWVERFAPLARDLEREGVRVVNATRETALRCFRRLTLEDALKV